MGATTARDWTIAQQFAVALGVVTVVLGVIGLAINPDFSVGDDATAEAFAGVDWNGWHGVAAISVGLPGIAVAWLPKWAVPYLVYRAVADAAVSAWVVFDDRPLGLLFLPTNGDLVFHLIVTGVATFGALLGVRAAGGSGRPVIPA